MTKTRLVMASLLLVAPCAVVASCGYGPSIADFSDPPPCTSADEDGGSTEASAADAAPTPEPADGSAPDA